MQQLESLGLSRLTKTNISLIKTFGKIKNVKNEGFYVDVELLLNNEGLEAYNNIPTLRSKFYNYPIREGDLVILLTLSHLQNDFFEKGVFNEFPASYDSYIALPISTLEQFLNASGATNENNNEVINFTNFFHIRTPKLNFQAQINEEKALIKAENVDYEAYFKNWTEVIKADKKETIEGKYTGEYKSTFDETIEGKYTGEYKSTFDETIEGNGTLKFKANLDYSVEGNYNLNIKGNYNIKGEADIVAQSNSHLELNSKGSLVIQGTQPITIRVSENLGSLIAEGFNLIAGSMTGPIPQSPSGTQVGPTMANGGELSAVASRILRVCN